MTSETEPHEKRRVINELNVFPTACAASHHTSWTMIVNDVALQPHIVQYAGCLDCCMFDVVVLSYFLSFLFFFKEKGMLRHPNYRILAC